MRLRGTSPVAVTGFAIVVMLALLALAAPLVLPGSPTEIASGAALRAPTVVEPFGMDDLGRSVLSRVIHGYRVSLGVALASVAMAVLLGLPLGLLAGYAEGMLDQPPEAAFLQGKGIAVGEQGFKLAGLKLRLQGADGP